MVEGLDRDTVKACLEAVDRCIARGPLPGSGSNQTAERNGLILAYNTLVRLQESKAARCKSCGERHDGSCEDALTTTEKARREAEKPARQITLGDVERTKEILSDTTPGESHELPVEMPIQLDVSDRELIREALARVESLESRVGVLESRKRYMRDYQRRKRAEESGGSSK